MSITSAHNDTYGHPEATPASPSSAKRCPVSPDAMGFAGRYGGEEFCLLLPNTMR
jgi:GGDEF domain-containing protein